MLSTTARSRDLTAGLLISLCVHALVGGVFAGVGLSPVRDPGANEVTTILDEELAREPEPDELILGNGEREADTRNWLGVDSPQEHQAPKSEVEQPELSLNPGASLVAAPQPSTSPIAPPEAAQLPPGASAPSREAADHQTSEAAPQEAPPHPLPADLPNTPIAVPTPPSPPAQPAASKPGRGAGIPSTSESAAAALKDAVAVSPGGVISAKGLQVSTVRPEWSVITRVTRAPGNPVVCIRFRRDGRAADVRFLSDGKREYRTGFADVDEPLITALYKWTAKGDALDRLSTDDPETGITITFKILLSRG